MNKIFISHRGNLSGPNPEKENSPLYIQAALDAGFNVEVDAWWHEGTFWLGHDKPQYSFENPFFLTQKGIWVHCKNLETLFQYSLSASLQSANPYPEYFFHQTDDAVLTSNGWIWTFPGKKLTPFSIAVKPEGFYSPEELKSCAGVCSDWIERYR